MNSLCWSYGWKPTVNSSISRVQKQCFTVACPRFAPSILDKCCNSTSLAFAALFQISVCPYSLKAGQRDIEIRMLLHPCLTETHYTALTKLQICPRQHFKLIHLIWERSLALWWRESCFELLLSLSPLWSYSTSTKWGMQYQWQLDCPSFQIMIVWSRSHCQGEDGCQVTLLLWSAGRFSTDVTPGLERVKQGDVGELLALTVQGELLVSRCMPTERSLFPQIINPAKLTGFLNHLLFSLSHKQALRLCLWRQASFHVITCQTPKQSRQMASLPEFGST